MIFLGKDDAESNNEQHSFISTNSEIRTSSKQPELTRSDFNSIDYSERLTGGRSSRNTKDDSSVDDAEVGTQFGSNYRLGRHKA